MGSPLHIFVNGIESNQANICMPVSISHGRSNPNSQPDAPQFDAVWWDDASAPQIGDHIHATLDLPTSGVKGTYDDPLVMYDDPKYTYSGDPIGSIDRFDGFVTDRNVHEWEGLPTQVQIVAVGGLSKLGLRTVQLDRPQEDDVTRVHAIANAIGLTLRVLGNPSAQLLSGEVSGTALSLIHEVCASTGGLLWQEPDGTIIYGTGDHRRIALPLAALQAYTIISGLDWQSALSDMYNRVTVNYGEPAASTTVTDDLSISLYDIRDTTVSTLLVDQAAADQFAALVLARRAFPFSRITDIMLDSEASIEAITTFMVLSVSDAILLPVSPSPGPAGTLAEWIVEGWQEEWTASDHVEVQLAVTDRARFALTVLRFWSHALANTWQGELDRGTWLDALILQPGEAA